MLKKSTLIILAVCLIIGGIGIGATGVMLGGRTQLVLNNRDWDFINFDEEDEGVYEESNKVYLEEKREELGAFKKIDVKSGTVAITIREGKEYSIDMEIGSKVELKYGVKGDTLYVEQKKQHTNNNIFGTYDWKKYGGEITITVPEGEQLERTLVELGVGEGKFENLNTEQFKLVVGVADTYIQGLTAKNVKIEGGVGEITLEEGNLDEADITIGVGSIKIETILNGDLDIQGGVGDLKILLLQGTERDYNYDISRGGGQITINDTTYNGIGDINVKNNSKKTIDIDAGLGSISIQTDK